MSEDFIKPEVIDAEIILDPDKVIMSKTDKYGIFEFANDYFMEISGYEEYELMGKSMFCVQHPDMPEVIFKMMWEKLLSKQDFYVIVKNLAKSGKFYWSITNFTFKINNVDGEIEAIYSKRVAANRKSIEFFSKLYKTLLNIEKKNGIDAAEKFIIGFLEEKQTDFSSLVQSFYKDNVFNKNANTNASPIVKVSEQKNATVASSEKLKELQEKAKNVIEDSSKIKTSKPKKSLFQKLFGKTEEELEEERRRKGE